MALSLPVLLLLVAASPWETLADRPAPTNAERAKRGLLPRKAKPSRVTYLEGAARRKGEVREFPGPAAPPAVIEAAVDPTAAVAPASEAVVPQPPAREVDPQAPVQLAQVTEAAAPPPRATASPAEGAGSVEVARTAPPPVQAADPRAEEAADRARDAEAVSVAFVSERWVDARGRVMERRLDRNQRVLSVRVVAMLDALPVLQSRRLPDGRIRDRVELEGTYVDVLRDPVGRFLSARAAPGPGED